MKLGAFVLTYNRPAVLRKSLEAMLSQTRPPDTLVVVENGDAQRTREVVREFPVGVELAATGHNLGSAGGTEFGYRWLYDRGFDLLYCGDDDNPPRTPDTVERLVRVLTQTGSEVAGSGTVGVRWNWHKGELVRLPDESLHGLVDVDFIGGGHKQLMRREVIGKVGPPDGRLFFGYPDLEHCLRIRSAGYRLVIDGDLMHTYREINDRLGRNGSRSALPRRPFDSVWRSYYTTRNYIFMMRHTFGRPDLARREALKALGRITASLARGPRYGARFIPLQLRGVLDGYRGHMGPTVLPLAKPEPRG